MAFLVSIVRAWSGVQVTLGQLGIAFLASLVIIVVIHLIIWRKKKGENANNRDISGPLTHYKIISPILVIVVFLLIGWNISLQIDVKNLEKSFVRPARVKHLEAEMFRYVLPRELTGDQIKQFGDYLKAHSQPHELKITWVLGDGESERYAEDFESAFQAGGWVVISNQIDEADTTCRSTMSKNMPPIECTNPLEPFINSREGIECNVAGPMLPDLADTVEEKIRAQTPLYRTINESFGAAHIPVSCGGGGRQNDPSDVLKISMFIGRRPRDKYGILPPGFSDLKDTRTERMRNLNDDDY